MNLSEDFWDNRYKNSDTGWDLGQISPPLKSYIDQLKDKSIKVLIPGGGNSYEAEYLFKQGFKNVYVADVSQTALHNIKSRMSNFPSNQLLHKNVFDLENITFDLIIEQTFFCAIEPRLRNQYVIKMNQLLSSQGKLVGLLFNAILNTDRPPFGGSKSEYLKRFNPIFNILLMEKAYNSHVTRAEKELFIILKKIN